MISYHVVKKFIFIWYKFKNKIFYTEEEIVEQRSNTNMKKIFLTNKRLSNDDFKKLNNNIRLKN